MIRLLLLVIINFQLSIIHSFAAQSAANAKLRVGYPSPSAAFYPVCECYAVVKREYDRLLHIPENAGSG